MEEDQYRDTYRQINPLKCVFEKAINSRRCQCNAAHRFCLADREGVSCTDKDTHRHCLALLDAVRNNALFAMRLTRVDGPLPHNKEMRVQIGGLLGLQKLLHIKPKANIEVADIKPLITRVLAQYGDIAQLPFDQIVQQIVHYEGRSRRQRKPLQD